MPSSRPAVAVVSSAVPPAPAGAPPRADRRAAWLAVALALGTAALFGAAVGYEFIGLDDPGYVTANPLVQRGLSAAGAAWAFTTGHASNWHPLTWLSLQLDATLFGPGPAGFHATNVGLHALNAALAFTLLRRLTGATARSVVAAALFAWHPLRLESVAWIAERKDVLSGLFFFLTLHAYVRWVRPDAGTTPRARVAWCAAALGAAALGLMSKPMLVTLPCVLLLLDAWPLGRFAAGGPGWRRLVGEKLPFAALAVASSVVTYLVQQAGGAVRTLAAQPLEARAGNAVVSVALYLRDTLWPAELAVFYPHPGRWPWAAVLGAGALLAAVGAAAWLGRRVRPAAWVGWCWFAGMLVPTLGLVQVGDQARADRYTYLPHVGLFVAAVWLVADAARGSRAARRGAAALAVTAVALSAAATAGQLRYWRDTVALFTRTAAVTGDNFLAHYVLGHHWLEHGELARAAEHLERSLALRPGFAGALNNLGSVRWRQERYDEALENFRGALATAPGFGLARSNLGIALLQLGRVDEAIVELEQAVAARPGDPEARLYLGNARLARGDTAAAAACFEAVAALRPDLADAHNNLGDLRLREGKTEAALECFRRAVAADPRHGAARFNLAEAHRVRGELAEAAAAYEELLRWKPDDAQAHLMLGLVRQDRREYAAAAAHLRRVTELRPDDARALAALGWLRATCPDPTQRDAAAALDFARRAERIAQGDDPLVLRTLAAALAEDGRFPEAAYVARQAVSLAREAGADGLVPWIEPQVACYESGRPWREGAAP